MSVDRGEPTKSIVNVLDHICLSCFPEIVVPAELLNIIAEYASAQLDLNSVCCESSSESLQRAPSNAQAAQIFRAGFKYTVNVKVDSMTEVNEFKLLKVALILWTSNADSSRLRVRDLAECTYANPALVLPFNGQTTHSCTTNFHVRVTSGQVITIEIDKSKKALESTLGCGTIRLEGVGKQRGYNTSCGERIAPADCSVLRFESQADVEIRLTIVSMDISK